MNKQRRQRENRQFARLGPIYPIRYGDQLVASLDPYTENGEIRLVNQKRRGLGVFKIRVRNGKLLQP